MFRPGHRRLALLGSLLMLPGCSGLGVFLDDTHSATSHVNRPLGNSENMQRAEGSKAAIEPLASEHGNVWPGEVKPPPTLEDLQNLPARTLSREDGVTPPTLSNVPNLLIPPIPHHLQPRPGEDGAALNGPIGAPPPAPAPDQRLPPAASPEGRIIPTPRGNAVQSRTPSGIPQSNVPATPGVITVPNGNGTSTLIAPDGTITTVPTPK